MSKLQKYQEKVSKWVEENGAITLLNLGNFLSSDASKIEDLEDYCALDVVVSQYVEDYK